MRVATMLIAGRWHSRSRTNFGNSVLARIVVLRDGNSGVDRDVLDGLSKRVNLRVDRLESSNCNYLVRFGHDNVV